jgi:DNA-directed RNA polymerase subunit beta
MAKNLMDPREVMESLKDGLVNKISEFFPYEGRKHRLELSNINVDPTKDIDDVTSQKSARMRNRTWSTAIQGDVRLVDKESGKVLDEVKQMRLASVPLITRNYSFIIEGNEYQVSNQWRLKSGIYTRVKDNKELETQFNLVKGRGFRMNFDPKKRQFLLQYGTSNTKLYPVLRALGVSEEELVSAWGREVVEGSKKGVRKGELVKLAKQLNRRAKVTDDESAIPVIKEAYSQTKLLADTTEVTVGKRFDSVTPGALVAASKKLLAVNRGEAKVDNREGLHFKELWNVEDFLPERIKNSSLQIKRKIGNNIDRRTKVKQVITADVFNVPIKAFFTRGSAVAQRNSQINPLNIVGGHLQTTIMGPPGGITSEQSVLDRAKMIDPSHLGFLDPVHTPEGLKTGISLYLNLGVRKQGNEAEIVVWDKKAEKTVWVNPVDLAKAKTAFPDQYKWEGEGKNKKPVPINKKQVTVSNPEGMPFSTTPDDVDYILMSPRAMFSLLPNMVPFLPNDQGNRSNMAARHLDQAIALKHREAPLVQVHVGGKVQQGGETWEQVIGKYYSSFRALYEGKPIGGTVTAVKPDYIAIRDDKDGKIKKVPVYNNYPLNDKKAFNHAYPTVDVGDKVKPGQVIADSLFTKDGTLALGTNLRIGYLPYKGLVFEDGIVISEEASKKLTSEHLSKERVYVERNMTVDKDKFRAHFPGDLSDENAAKLDDEGVIKVGETVNPGEVLMTVMAKVEPSKEQLLLKGLHKSLARQYRDKSVVWNGSVTGVVTDVIRNGREITAYVRTEEPADIGDKLCFSDKHQIYTSRGWKPVAEITLEDMLPVLGHNGSWDFMPPRELHSYECDEEWLYCSANPYMEVTLDHRLFAMPLEQFVGVLAENAALLTQIADTCDFGQLLQRFSKEQLVPEVAAHNKECWIRKATPGADAKTLFNEPGAFPCLCDMGDACCPAWSDEVFAFIKERLEDKGGIKLLTTSRTVAKSTKLGNLDIADMQRRAEANREIWSRITNQFDLIKARDLLGTPYVLLEDDPTTGATFRLVTDDFLKRYTGRVFCVTMPGRALVLTRVDMDAVRKEAAEKMGKIIE